MRSRVPLRAGLDRVRGTCTAADGAEAVFTPLGYEPGYDYPLVVWLPDASAPRFDLGRAMRRLSLRNYVAVLPSGTSDGSVADPEPAVWRAIDRVRNDLSVHPDRIFLVGSGAGGMEAFRIGCRHPGAFAGLASLGGAFPLDSGLFARLADVRRLPMLLCCRRDAPTEFARRIDRTLRVFHAAGALLSLRIYPGGDDLSKGRLGDLNRWLMDEVCGTARPVASCAG